jgi:hypothetical protein
MMQVLTSRLQRLERITGAAACAECGGDGLWAVTYEGEAPTAIRGRGRGCPACGRVNHIIVRYEPVPLPGSGDVHENPWEAPAFA